METVLQDVRQARRGVTAPSQPGAGPAFSATSSSSWASSTRRPRTGPSSRAASWARRSRRSCSRRNVLSEEQLSRATAELHGLDHVDLHEFEVDLDVARLISKSAARRYQAVPIAFDDEGTLLVALSDPVDPLAVDDIAVMTKSDVHPMVATQSSIDAVIEQLADAPAQPAQLEEPRIESVYGRPPEAPSAPEPAAGAAPAAEAAPAAAPPAAPDPGAGSEEMAQMRQALADLAARVESFTAPPAEQAPAPPAPTEPADPAVSVEEHDGVLNRLEEAERRASEADGALDRLADAERRATEADGALDRLADAERRAKEAEAALDQMRTERDRERQRHQQAEQELRAQIESAKEATRRLEQRLANVLAVTAEIRAACERLVEQPPR